MTEDLEKVRLPALSKAETVELVRMLLARKIMPEDRRATLSPIVNAPLAQALALVTDLPEALAPWLPRLATRFREEMADGAADPSLQVFLRDLPDDRNRQAQLAAYFLPFPPLGQISIASAETMAGSFGTEAPSHPTQADCGPLHPARPEDGRLVFARPFLPLVFGQVLMSRHAHLHLEMRRAGETDAAASDSTVVKFIDLLATEPDQGFADTPFYRRCLRNEDFAQSFAYTQMMELGFSREEMMAALAPWELVD